MLNETLIYIGSAIIIAWGVAHIMATKPVIKGFGRLSIDNQRILAMEWIAEGISLCFIGLLVVLTVIMGQPGDALVRLILGMSALILFVFAGLAVFTGARTSKIPFKICPFIEVGAGVLILIGSFSLG